MKQIGEILFEKYYSEVYGERWAELKQALEQSPKYYVARINPYSKFEIDEKYQQNGEVEQLENCYWAEKFPPPSFVKETGLRNYYLMDLGSIVAANSLGVEPGDEVLDMCAAPGGKSLILAEKIGEEGSMVANERSAERRGRLRRVLQEYLPDDLREQIKVTSHDAGIWCLYEQEKFDKILLDVPCSSEGHLLRTPKLLKKWKEGRTKRLAKDQYTLLCSALTVVKTGGRILYSTCSISPRENDEVVGKLLEKKGDQAVLKEIDTHLGEKTEFGKIVLPDKCQWGPIYFSLIEKR